MKTARTLYEYHPPGSSEVYTIRTIPHTYAVCLRDPDLGVWLPVQVSYLPDPQRAERKAGKIFHTLHAAEEHRRWLRYVTGAPNWAIHEFIPHDGTLIGEK